MWLHQRLPQAAAWCSSTSCQPAATVQQLMRKWWPATCTNHRDRLAARCMHSSSPTSHASSQLQLAVPTEGALQALASLLAYQSLSPGDVYLLRGEVGAGKSTFSRAFIRAAAGDEELPVPSPTFLLQNTYGEDVLGDAPPLHHFDLYRLTGPASTLERLELPTSFQKAVCLVEWAERLPVQLLPASRLDVNISITDNGTSGGSSPQQHKSRLGYDGSSDVSMQPENGASAASDAEEYTDSRPRAVELTAFGEYWQARLQQVQQLLQDADAEGLRMVH